MDQRRARMGAVDHLEARVLEQNALQADREPCRLAVAEDDDAMLFGRVAGSRRARERQGEANRQKDGGEPLLTPGDRRSPLTSRVLPARSVSPVAILMFMPVPAQRMRWLVAR